MERERCFKSRKLNWQKPDPVGYCDLIFVSSVWQKIQTIHTYSILYGILLIYDVCNDCYLSNWDIICQYLYHLMLVKMQQNITRLGRWIDFTNDYKTMYPSFMESIWWVFKQLYDKGLVYRGFKVFFCRYIFIGWDIKYLQWQTLSTETVIKCIVMSLSPVFSTVFIICWREIWANIPRLLVSTFGLDQKLQELKLR